MSAQIPAYPLRMPAELREWFEAAAKQAGRSLNSEIVRCLMEVQARRGGTSAGE
jgi:predicted HicB family RNase H-like nuclease